VGKIEYARLAFDIRLWKWLFETPDTHLWKRSDRDISHLWERYKAVVVINLRVGYARMPA